MSINPGYIFRLGSDTDDWVFNDDDTQLRWWKEVIYADDFYQETTNHEFEVDLELLEHWRDVHDQMIAAGHVIPVPLLHTNDPTQKQGEIKKYEVKKDSKGRNGLFALFEFSSAEAAKAAKEKKNGVSIYSPPYFHDDKKRRFRRPILHIALTDRPTVSGLDGWVIAASSVSTRGKKETTMSMKTLAQTLGIKVEDSDTDEMIEKGIIALFKKTEPDKKPESDKKSEPDKKPESQPIAAALVSEFVNSRGVQIDALVPKHITPAVASGLKETWANKETVALALSSDVDDGFRGLIDTLKKNVASLPNAGELTGDQTVSLSADKNPLIADAESRAK